MLIQICIDCPAVSHCCEQLGISGKTAAISVSTHERGVFYIPKCFQKGIASTHSAPSVAIMSPESGKRAEAPV